MKIGEKTFDFGKKTYIMGILNVTPDSFSDGGKFNSVETAVKHAIEMIEAGADIIDIGGESTRPNHEYVEAEEEIRRVIPVIKAVREAIDIPISIDTYKAVVAEAAILAGASLINDVWGFKHDKDMAKIAAKYGVPCCIMHNREDLIASSYTEEQYMEQVLKDVIDIIEKAISAGVKRENIILDPGIGFAKTYEQNLITMKHLEKFKSLGMPVLLGTSRKSMIGNTLNLPSEERVEGTLATTTFGIMKGCDIIRVHDVKENKRAAMMTDAMLLKK